MKDYITVYTIYYKTKWTWNYTDYQRIGFRKYEDAKYACYCANRHLRRLANKKNKKHLRILGVISTSCNNPTVTVEPN